VFSKGSVTRPVAPSTRPESVVFCAGGAIGLDFASICGVAILAEFELAFDVLDSDAKAYDFRQHRTAEISGHSTPFFRVSRLMGMH